MDGYMSGFGNEFATEALPGALPVGQNSPQRAPLGLYTEVLSGTSFTTPRAGNRHAWLYRIRPSVGNQPFAEVDARHWVGAPFNAAPPSPNQLRWNPLPIPLDATEPTDFVQGITTLCGAGDPAAGTGIAAHVYVANRSMSGRYLSNSDAEMLLVPQLGSLVLHTEFGRIDVAPHEIAVIPRAVRVRVELGADAANGARGFLCENFGAVMRLPELGPIGSAGLANPRDFLTPVAAWEDVEGEFELLNRFQGRLWSAHTGHSPLDVVAWHGNYAPYKYDLARFNTLGTVSFDHPDPSLFTVLTAHSDTPGVANLDFVIFPPRWTVAEGTYRPPWYHRNVMSEFMGLVHGKYDTRAEGFLPGGATLHNAFAPHGSDRDTYEKHASAALVPVKLTDTLAFMFETRYVLRPTPFALGGLMQQDYWRVWQGIEKHFGR